MAGLTGDDLATGTIRQKPEVSPFAADMDAEDWRRAKSALDTALDPQGNGATVAWDNAQSGAKGVFVPTSQPYPKDDGICRQFAARVTLKGESERSLRSSACRINSGAWVIGRVMLVEPSKQASKKGEILADRDTSTQLR